MFCSNCGKEIEENASFCKYCGVSTNTKSLCVIPKNDWLVTLLLCIFLGAFGIHRLYVGKTKTGIAQLIMTLTSWLIIPGIVVGIWIIVDLIMIITRNFKTINGEDLI